MFCRVLACDSDGTTAHSGVLASAAAEAVRRARSRGFIAPGNGDGSLASLSAADVAPFDGILAENGAILWLTER
jgi:hypothetical protein